MNINSYQWVLEVVLIGMLAATLFYAMRLEKTIRVLRDDRVNLGDVLLSIRTALDDAERGILLLQNMADNTGRALTHEISVAAQAQEDLRFLLDRIDTVANKVENTIRSGRASLAPVEEPRLAAGPVHSKAERDLLKVLRLSK